MIEVSITVRDSEQSLTQKHLVESGDLHLSYTDPQCQAWVLDIVRGFHTEAHENLDIIIRAKMVWQ